MSIIIIQIIEKNYTPDLNLKTMRPAYRDEDDRYQNYKIIT